MKPAEMPEPEARPDDPGGQPADPADGAATPPADGVPPGAGGTGVVIDLTGASADHGVTVSDAPAVPLAAHGRRRVLALGAALLLACALAATNFVIGMQWRSQALAAQDRAGRAVADVAAKQQAVLQARADRDAADLRREAMANRLAVSEADVAALEARFWALASDRAQAEDYGDYAAVVDASARMRIVGAQVESCIAQVKALRTSLLQDARETALQEMVAAAESTCEQIGADVAVLAADE